MTATTKTTKTLTPDPMVEGALRDIDRAINPLRKTTSKQARHSRFQRHSAVFDCRNCGRPTRDTGDNGDLHTCPQCYELAGYENALMDRGELDAGEQSTVKAYLDELASHIGDRAYTLHPELFKAVMPATAAVVKEEPTPATDSQEQGYVGTIFDRNGQIIWTEALPTHKRQPTTAAAHHKSLNAAAKKYTTAFRAEISLIRGTKAVTTLHFDFNGPERTSRCVEKAPEPLAESITDVRLTHRIVVADNSWGKGQTTAQAKAAYLRERGKPFDPKSGRVFAVTPSTYISEVGGFCFLAGEPAPLDITHAPLMETPLDIGAKEPDKKAIHKVATRATARTTQKPSLAEVVYKQPVKKAKKPADTPAATDEELSDEERTAWIVSKAGVLHPKKGVAGITEKVQQAVGRLSNPAVADLLKKAKAQKLRDLYRIVKLEADLRKRTGVVVAKGTTAKPAPKPTTPKGEMSEAMRKELKACAKGKPTQDRLGSCMRMHLKMRGLISDHKTGALTAAGKKEV